MNQLEQMLLVSRQSMNVRGLYIFDINCNINVNLIRRLDNLDNLEVYSAKLQSLLLK